MHACVYCSLHGVYCLQLERFLCHECGKVKCSCGVTSIAEYQAPVDIGNPDNGTTRHDLDNDSIEYRKPAFIRQYSRSDQSKSYPQKPLSLSTEVPPDKSPPESGKLRRSFIVRSREGLENFLNFSSKKSHEEKDKMRQQF